MNYLLLAARQTMLNLVYSTLAKHDAVVGVALGKSIEICTKTYWFVAAVASVNNWIKKIFEYFIALLVSGDAAHRHDEGMSRVINTCIITE